MPRSPLPYLICPFHPAQTSAGGLFAGLNMFANSQRLLCSPIVGGIPRFTLPDPALLCRSLPRSDLAASLQPSSSQQRMLSIRLAAVSAATDPVLSSVADPHSSVSSVHANAQHSQPGKKVRSADMLRCAIRRNGPVSQRHTQLVASFFCGMAWPAMRLPLESKHCVSALPAVNLQRSTHGLVKTVGEPAAPVRRYIRRRRSCHQASCRRHQTRPRG